MSRWIDAMLPAERDELIDAGRIGPSRFDGPDEGEEPDPIDLAKAYRDAYGPDFRHLDPILQRQLDGDR